MADGLSQSDRELLAKVILEGRRIPAKYAPSVIESSPEMELVWAGKSDKVEQIVLPFQSVEIIDEPRTEFGQIDDLFSVNADSGRQGGGWSNKLIWGDNKFVIASLSRGPLRREIEKVGGIKLIYIDPPFDVGYDFSLEIEVGEDSFSKEPSVLEQLAYRDTWGKGSESFVSMIYERLLLMKDLLASDGSIYVHCDWRVSGLIRVLMDEVFGSENFLNHIIWTYNTRTMTTPYFARKHNDIFLYSRNAGSHIFNEDEVRVDLKPESLVQYNKIDEEGRRYKAQSNGGRTYLNELGQPCPDVWNIQILGSRDAERTGYATQKPEALLERIIRASSREGDLVADFFAGSGTTMATAEKLGRKWIGADLGRFAIHTSRKRLISVQRERKEKGFPFRSFEILNLGGYEREHFLDRAAAGETSSGQASKRREAFVELVLSAYGALPVVSLPPFAGTKQQTAVFVGEVDRAVSQVDVESCIEAALTAGISKVDVLGFEFEMGISPVLADRAKEKGLTLSIRYIPSDVFDSRAVKAGLVQFFEVGYLEVIPEVKGASVRVKLTDFGVFYRQTDADDVAFSLKPGSSKVVVDDGQVIKVTKSKEGVISREPVTRQWQDWIDYWSVDFDYESKPEVLSQVNDGEEIEQKSGRYLFENEWQSFRTAKSRQLELVSAWHVYESSGPRKIAVKVIDIFGNDTTKVISIKAG